MPHVASRGGVVADEKFAESNLLGKSYCAICHGDMVIGKLGQMTGICIFLSLFAEARVSTYLTQNVAECCILTVHIKSDNRQAGRQVEGSVCKLIPKWLVHHFVL